MAKRQRLTARRGPRGLRGRPGATGVTGATGPSGPVGETGARGPVGPAGHTPNRADVLAMVEDQFIGVRKEMSLQLARMGQIQTQLDQIHTMLKKLVRED